MNKFENVPFNETLFPIMLNVILNISLSGTKSPWLQRADVGSMDVIKLYKINSSFSIRLWKDRCLFKSFYKLVQGVSIENKIMEMQLLHTNQNVLLNREELTKTRDKETT